MKLIVKIEIVILVLVLLIGGGMVLLSEGFLLLFQDIQIQPREIPPIPTDPVVTQEEAPAQVEEESPEVPAQGITRSLTAKKYFAYDIRKGEYLLQEGDGEEKLYPASITKLLTCHVVLSYMPPETEVTVGSALDLVLEDSSVAGLERGDTVTVENLIAAMLLPSGNDAAQTAAVEAGRVIAEDENLSAAAAKEVFVEQMNQAAQELGMVNSHFENPDGYHHENHYTTMNDLVTLCETVLTNQTILKYTSRLEETVKLSGRELEWTSTNLLLDSQEDVYLPGTIGLKTGFTNAAGSCLLSAFFQEDRLVLIGVFGCPARTDDRYLDTVAIYNSL